MKRTSLLLAVLATAALALPAFAQGTTGTSTVTLAASAQVMLNVLDPAITLTPTATDYNNNYVDAAGASGIRVNVKTNSSTGCALLITDQDAVPQIALADLLIRTQTAPLGGGTSLASYTPVTAVNQALWTSTVSVHGWRTVTTDVRIQNLLNYDAPGVGTASYMNTLTYTIITQ